MIVMYILFVKEKITSQTCWIMASNCDSACEQDDASFSNETNNEQQSAQMDAVAAAAAFLLSFPVETLVEDHGSAASSFCSSQNSHQLLSKPAYAISQKGNPWIHLGSFLTEEEMHLVRNKEKVSKRRTEQLKNGVKVRYRCNTWKRTKCGFQMFSFQHTHNGIFELYECGQHDHSGRRKLEYELYGPLRRRALSLQQNASSSNDKLLGEIMTEVKHNEVSEDTVASEGSASSTDSTSLTSSSPFWLTDEKKKEKICEIAAEFGLTFFNRNSNEFVVCLKDLCLLTVVESKESMMLKTEDGEQRWTKADGPQFLWAIRGLFAFLATNR